MECQICQTRYGYMIIHEGEDFNAKIKSTIDNYSNVGNLVKEVHTVCLKCLMARAFKCEYCTRHCVKLVNILQIINEPENPDYIYYDSENEVYPKLFFGDSEPYYPPGVKPGSWFKLTKEFVEMRSKQNPNFEPESFPDNPQSQETPRETPPINEKQQIKSNIIVKTPFPYHLLKTLANKACCDTDFVKYIRDILYNKYNYLIGMDIIYLHYIAVLMEKGRKIDNLQLDSSYDKHINFLKTYFDF